MTIPTDLLKTCFLKYWPNGLSLFLMGKVYAWVNYATGMII